MVALVVIASCLVIGVSDGDTLTTLCDQKQIKVRLAEIDAPEKAQPFGQKAKQSLAEMCFQKHAEIRVQAKDRYGRMVARVDCEGVDANAEQIKRGMAWVYDKYVTDSDLYQLQDEARVNKRGLWIEKEPTRPWEWRKAKRGSPRTNRQ